MSSRSVKLTAVGLFSGCGGFDFGASLAGFDLVSAYDNDPFALETYRRNVSPNAEQFDLSEGCPMNIPRGIDLILGGPPCQGFSTAGGKASKDERNLLWKSYVKAITKVRPKAFALENVYGFSKVYNEFSETLNEETNDDYLFEYKKINTQFYGVPQCRRRLFVIGVRKDVAKAVPWPTPHILEVSNMKKEGGFNVVPGMVSMETALAGIGPAKVIEDKREKNWGCPHEYVVLEKSHAMVAPHIPNGGSLRSIPTKSLPEIYRERSREGNPSWHWYYRKTNPLQPSRTVTAAIGPCFSEILAPDAELAEVDGHWSWNIIDPVAYTDHNGLYTSPIPQRRLTIKECARLQTFPEDFEFFGSALDKHRQIGNAVPVEFARQLCSAIKKVLK
jgi:DNA (cytosine-5)-methyltransferase 1